MTGPEPHRAFEGMTRRQIKKLSPGALWKRAEPHLEQLEGGARALDLGNGVSAYKVPPWKPGDLIPLVGPSPAYHITRSYKAIGRRKIFTETVYYGHNGLYIGRGPTLYMTYPKAAEPDLRARGVLESK